MLLAAGGHVPGASRDSGGSKRQDSVYAAKLRRFCLPVRVARWEAPLLDRPLQTVSGPLGPEADHGRVFIVGVVVQIGGDMSKTLPVYAVRRVKERVWSVSAHIETEGPRTIR